LTDQERNRFSARAARYARVGTNVGGVAARVAANRVLGLPLDRARNAAELALALGGLKGPIMKVAQLLATIPDALPAEYAAELTKLQSEAPPMGWAFVKRRMSAELGPDWQQKFASFEHRPAAAASLGQVHRASAHDGSPLACKLQYPDMKSAVEADLRQLEWLFALHRRMEPVIDTSEIGKEIAARLREELDYEREARHVALYRTMLADVPEVRVPRVWPQLSTHRLLTLEWLEGDKLLTHKGDSLEIRISAITPPSMLTASHAASISSTTDASAFSRRLSSAVWSISITACAPAMTRWWCTPTRPGGSGRSRAISSIR
jgi:predicted unusual protein kinase regulating ubiquinone biosynthesis (AarF/ABC1/UbiB family)